MMALSDPCRALRSTWSQSQRDAKRGDTMPIPQGRRAGYA